jgi:hypothetical protein
MAPQCGCGSGSLPICQRPVNESRGDRFGGHLVAVRQQVGVGPEQRLRIVAQAPRYDVQRHRRGRGQRKGRGGVAEHVQDA